MPHAPLPARRHADRPPRRGARGLVAAVAGALALLTVAAGAGPAWAVGGPARGEQVVTVVGTVEQAVVDRVEHTGGHEDAPDADHVDEQGAQPADGQGLVLDTMVLVGGELLDLPEPVVRAGEAAAGGDLRTGDTVEVTLAVAPGTSPSRALAAAQDATDPDARVVAVTAAPGTAAAAVPAATPTLGAHTLTVLPVHWGTRDSATRASLSSLAGQAAQYWAEQSGGRLTFQPSVRDWAAVADPGSCDTAAIMRSALAAHGVPASSGTSHVAVYFPARADCGGWAGMGSISGTRIWVNGVPTVDVLAHELGHNLGLGHASTATCQSSGVQVSLSADCSVSAYADIADVMGFGTDMVTGNLNTALADRLGFARVLQVTDLPVTLDIARLADVGRPRAVRLATAHGPVYVDFRPAQGRDVRRPAWAGVQVHRLTGNGYPESQLLDMQPARAGTFAGAALPVGGSWAIPGTGQTLTVNATSQSTATLSLTGAAGPGTGTAPVALGADLRFVPVTPVRLIDTRETGTPLGAGEQRHVVVAGTRGIPPEARAVAVNLTAVGASSVTHLRAWPAGGAVAESSVLNTDPSRVAATGVLLGVGAGRSVTLFNAAGRVDVLADVTGYYVPTGGHGFEGLASPVRLLDTRTGVGAAPGAVTDGGVRTVAIAGRPGVPPDATAVLVNVTSVGPAADGHVAAYPGGSAHPGTSTVNHVPGTASTNRATVKLGGGALAVEVRGAPAHVLVDLVGWYGPSGTKLFTPVVPVRAFDTRSTGQRLGTAQSRTFDVRTSSGAGTSEGAAVMILTATASTAPETYLTAWQGTTAQPPTSDLNVRAATDQANLAVVPWSGTGSVRVFNNLGDVHVVGDLLGYFS